MLTVKSISRDFRSAGSVKKALININLDFADKGLVCICGKSGSGKTTLLNLMGLQDSPTSGEILYNGKNIFLLSEKEKNRYRSSAIGRVSQDYDLIDELSVMDNCAMSIKLTGNRDKKCFRKITGALHSVNLDGFEGRKVNELSGGEKQRVSIARALAKNTKILLCDEPTGNLDPDAAKEVMEILKAVSLNVCVIVVTHNRTLAEKYADRIISLDQGAVLSDRIIAPSGSCNRRMTEDHQINEKNLSDRTKEPGSFSYFRRFVFLIFKSRIIVSSVAFLLLFALISILFSASAMSRFNEFESMASTLTENSIYIVPLCQYKEWLGSDGPYIEYGWHSFAYKHEETEALEKNNPELEFAEVYSFSKSLYDFTDGIVFSSGSYNTVTFSDFVAVKDYSKFKNPLTEGRYPESWNEVIISDYMAEMIVYHKAFPEVNKAEDLIGFTFTEKATGFSMTVSGLYKTNYTDFSDIGEDTQIFGRDAHYYSGNACLALYGNVYGKPKLIQSVTDGNFSASFETMTIEYYPDEYLDEKKVSKTYYGTLHWFVTPQTAAEKGITVVYSSGYGAMIRDTVLADFLGISLEELYEMDFSELIGDHTDTSFKGEKTVFGQSEPSCFKKTDPFHWATTGIFHSDSDCAPDTIGLMHDGDSYFQYQCYSGVYIGPAVLLSGNVAEDSSFLSAFTPVLHDPSAWDDEDDCIPGDFSVYSYMRDVISYPSEYLEIMNILYKDYSWVLTVLLVIALSGYLIITVKKNARSIGILRSSGISGMKIMLIYTSLSVLLTGCAVILAIPGAMLILHRANAVLSTQCGCSAVFYILDFNSVISASVWVGLSIIVSLIALYLWIKIRNPVSLIYNRKN